MQAGKRGKVLPYTDIFVRYLLGDEKNTDLLLSFINAVNADHNLPLIRSVTIRNPYNLKEFFDEKESILDVKATDETGEIYNIEIQASGNESFKHRALYYWSKLYSSQISTGARYFDLVPTICINLLAFDLIQSEKIHTNFGLYEKDNHDLMLTDHLAIHFIELNKFRKEKDFTSDLEGWLAFFKYEGQKEEIMQIVVKNNPTIAKAHRRFETFTQDDRLMEFYESHQKWLHDRNTEIGYAEMKGLERGLEQGMEQGELADKQQVLIRQTKKKFGLSAADEQLILSVHDADRLDSALDTVIFAEKLDDVLSALH